MWYSLRKTALCIGTLSVLLSGAAMAKGSYSSGGSSCSTSGGSQPSTPVCDSWGDALIYDLYYESTGSENVNYGWSTTGSSVVIDGVGIKVSGWSDTGDAAGTDATVEEANFVDAGPWYNSATNSKGYGMYNADEISFDRVGDYHALDNYGNWDDTDMVLLSFSESVSLTGATFSWAENNGVEQEVTAVGLTDISALTGGNSTWASIASSFVAANTAGSFIIEKCDDVFQSTFTTTGTAQYWLVGAYNAAFAYVDGFKKNDAFKLASIGFTKETEDGNTGGSEPVNAPGTLALLIIAGAYVGWRRKQQA